MKVKALRTIRTDAGNVRRGAISPELSGPVAKSLIERGLAEAVDEPADAADKPAKPHVSAKAKPKTKAKPKPADAADDAAASDAEGE